MRPPSIYLSLAAALLASGFAACGGSDPSSTGSPTGSGASAAGGAGGTGTTGTGASSSTSTGTGGTTSTGSTTGGTGGVGGTGTMPSSFGLDARPANPTCLAPDRPSSTPMPVKWERVYQNLSFNTPMGITQIPGDPSRFFVFRRNGTVVSFPAQSPTTTTTVLTIPMPVNTSGEGGMLGFAFHPQFLTNGHVFFSYTTNGGANGMRSVVARMTSADGGNTFGAYKQILIFDQPAATNHKGGDVHFGKDGFLYLSFGDGGPGGDPNDHGQDTTGFFSKILRIDVNEGDPYGIPISNPFVDFGGEPATFAYGFRNPFRFSIDRETGDVWVGDVGQGKWEEVDARVVAGGNYGWKTREGKHCYSPLINCPTAGLIDPIHEYPNTAGASITGGVVYRGKAIPDYVGKYLFADYVTQQIWSLAENGVGAPTVTQLNSSGPNGTWVGFGEDNDGEVYVVSLGNGQIYKLVPAGSPPPPSNFPDKLSKTGCVDPLDAKKPAAGVIPYAPHSELWSDQAEKERHLAIPDGTTVTIKADGDFDFPIGSVLMKSFRRDGKLVETRLFVRHTDGGWAGYTYEWDDAETDATLLPSSKKKTLPSSTQWYYPSRSECFACHTAVAGDTLGLEIGQLNADFHYPSTDRVANQLATLEHIGMFAAPLPGPVATLAQYPNPSSSEGTFETRARSYLHANCSFCHQPNAIGGGAMNLRYDTPSSMINACGVSPSAGDLGVPGSKLLVPGNPQLSLLTLRMKATGAGRMPPLATSVVDTYGASVVETWIQSLTACP